MKIMSLFSWRWRRNSSWTFTPCSAWLHLALCCGASSRRLRCWATPPLGGGAEWRVSDDSRHVISSKLLCNDGLSAWLSEVTPQKHLLKSLFSYEVPGRASEKARKRACSLSHGDTQDRFSHIRVKKRVPELRLLHTFTFFCFFFFCFV